jgi:hypothetical protein
MTKDQDKALREQLRTALRGDQSHIDFESAISDISQDLCGKKLPDAPHTIWQLLEHMRIAQNDLLEFSRNPRHKSPKWPEGYWPTTEAPSNERDFEASVSAFRREAQEMEELIENPNEDLFKPIQGGSGQTLLREALVLAAHNSYHLGQIMYLKKMLTNRN